MKKLILFLLFPLAVPAQVSLTGSMSVSGNSQIGVTQLTASVDATSVVLTWYTSTAATSSGSCGAINSPDNGVAAASTYHQVVVAGLTPSTAYTCTATSGTYSGNINVSTTALKTSTPITGVTVGAFTDYNATASIQMDGDTFYNCVSNDGTTYVETMDTSKGWSGTNNSSAYMLAKFTSLSPITGANVNPMTGFGPQGMTAGRSAKSGGIWCQGRMIIGDLSQVDETSTTDQPAYDGSMILSLDHGITWKNMQGDLSMWPKPLNPITTSMWSQIAPTNFGYINFVMYGADDGTSGALVADNREDNADAYVYGLSNVTSTTTTSCWQNGDAFYLVRVPRSKIANLSGADYQYFTGGDGNLDANWSSSQSAAVAVITNTASMGIASIQYIPALNRYLLATFNFPNKFPNAPTNWLFYEAPHPWGMWTLVTTVSTVTGNAYQPVILQADALSATFASTTMRLLFAETGANYHLWYATMTVNH